LEALADGLEEVAMEMLQSIPHEARSPWLCAALAAQRSPDPLPVGRRQRPRHQISMRAVEEIRDAADHLRGYIESQALGTLLNDALESYVPPAPPQTPDPAPRPAVRHVSALPADHQAPPAANPVTRIEVRPVLPATDLRAEFEREVQAAQRAREERNERQALRRRGGELDITAVGVTVRDLAQHAVQQTSQGSSPAPIQLAQLAVIASVILTALRDHTPRFHRGGIPGIAATHAQSRAQFHSPNLQRAMLEFARDQTARASTTAALRRAEQLANGYLRTNHSAAQVAYADACAVLAAHAQDTPLSQRAAAAAGRVSAVRRAYRLAGIPPVGPLPGPHDV
jgi:hypothetical protein